MSLNLLSLGPLGQWGEEIMAVEPGALKAWFAGDPVKRRRGESRADVSGTTIEWDECGLARVGAIALIQIEGPLSRRGGWFSSGYDEILEAHDRAVRSDAKALLQVHHSPGGYISGMDETAEEIAAMVRASGKPMHAISNSMMYSASVRLACPAEKWFVTRAGGIGSVGIVTQRMDYTKANEEMGLRVETVASGDRKTDGDPDVPITAAEIAAMRGRMNHHSALFFAAVAQSRGISIDDVQGQQAALYLGQGALAARMADGVSTLQEAIARLEQQVSGPARVQVPQGPVGQQRQQPTKARSMDNALLAVALGKLSAGASDQDITERAAALKAGEDKLFALTGKSTLAEQAAVVEGWKESAGKLKTAQDELAKVQEREEKATYSALVEKGEASAQITPANKAKVLDRFPTSASLSAYLETAPAALPSSTTAAQTAAHKGKGSEGKDPENQEAALTFKGKAWKDLTRMEQAQLYQEDRGLYDNMRNAAMKGGAQ